MKASLLATALATALAAGFAAAASAGPLNKSFVPADVQWVVHVDVEAGLASTLGRFAMDNAEGIHLNDLDEIKAELGIDPIKDIKGITVYGTGDDPHDGIALIEATSAVDQLIEHARKKEKTFEEITEGRLTLYRWSEHGSARYGVIRPGKAADERFVLVAPDKPRLLASLRVMDGKAESIARTKGGLLAKSPKAGSFVFAAAINLGDAEAVPFKKADGFLLDLGESDKELYADLVVVPKNVEDAKNLLNIIRGAVSMAVMFAQNDPGAAELAQLTDHLEYTADGGRITIHFSYPTEKLLQVLADAKAAHDESENKPAKVKPAGKNERDDRDR